MTTDKLIREFHDHGPFIASLQDHLPLKDLSEGDIILRTQSLAHSHYRALWNACTREEQYVLFDIAQDGLVNSKNIQVITALIEKGLLVYNGTLWLMNRSFRNFLLTEIRPEEVKLLEKEALLNGSWSAIRGPLIIIVVALAGFLFVTQQETYKQVVALLGTLTALIPVIIRLLGSTTSSLGKGTEKE